MTNIGRVDFLVDFDGKTLPRQAKRIGEQVGGQLGKSTASSFDKEMSGVGERLQRQMKEAGELSGVNFTKSLKGAILRQRGNLTDTLASIFADRDAFDDFVKSSGNVEDGLDNVRASMQKLRNEGGLTWNEFQSLNKTTEEWGARLKEAEKQGNALTEMQLRMRLEEQALINVQREENEQLKQLKKHTDDATKASADHDVALRKLTKSQEESSKSTKDNDFHWKSLGHNLRQAILIIGAVAAGGEQIASLSSGLSAALVAIGSSAGYAASGGLLALSAVLPNVIYGIKLAGESLKIFEEQGGEAGQGLARLKAAFDTVDAQAFATEWEGAFARFSNALAKSLEEDRIGEMTGKAFSKFTDAFTAVIEGPQWAAFRTAMETTLPNAVANFGTGGASVLQGILSVLEAAAPFAERMSEAFSAWAGEWAAAMDEANKNGGLTAFFEQAFASAKALWDVIKPFKDALGNVFQIGAVWGDRLLGTLGELAEKFLSFTESIEGQKALNNWFKNGEVIFNGFIDLIGAVGTALGNIVTDESIQRSAEFLDNLTGAVPFLEDIITTLGGLDAFGLVAQALNEVGNALGPVFDLLRPIGEIINTLVSTTLSMLAGAIGWLTPLLIPLQIAFELFNSVLQKAFEYMQPLIDAFVAASEPLRNMGNQILEGVIPAFEGMLDSIFNLLPEPEELARIIEEDVIPAIQSMVDWVVGEIVPALSDFWTAASDVIDELGGFEGILKSVKKFSDGFKQYIDALLWPLHVLHGAISGIIDLIQWLQNTKMPTFPGLGGGGGGGGVPQANASGTIATKATFGIYGEDGPEAIVPLNRPLSMVDPAVRDLSAIAQGKSTAAYNDSSTRSTVFEAGAIVVPGGPDPRQTVSAMMDRLVAVSEG